MQSFYQPVRGGYAATEFTRGPWSDAYQHGGPVAALMLRESLQALALSSEEMVSRFSLELVRPAPIATLELSSSIVRDGRMVRTASCSAHVQGKLIATMSVQTVREQATGLHGVPQLEELPGPDACGDVYTLPLFPKSVGYHSAIELRLARGTYGSGSLAAWLRVRVPLLPDEPLTPLQRVAVAADSGNGVSARLDPKQINFVNPDLTVCFARRPQGEWILLNAHTYVHPHGTGLADSELRDEHGPFGRALQTLIVRPHAS